MVERQRDIILAIRSSLVQALALEAPTLSSCCVQSWVLSGVESSFTSKGSSSPSAYDVYSLVGRESLTIFLRANTSRHKLWSDSSLPFCSPSPFSSFIHLR